MSLPYGKTSVDALERFSSLVNTRLNRVKAPFEIARGDDGMEHAHSISMSLTNTCRLVDTTSSATQLIKKYEAATTCFGTS